MLLAPWHAQGVANRRLPNSDLDPLERRHIARAVVLAALVAAGLTLWLGVDGEFHDGLPGIALGSPFLLHVERALALVAGIAALLMFAVRGWAGYFPSKISTGGAEYFDRSAAGEAAESWNAVYDEIDRLNATYRGLAGSTQARLDEVEHDVGALMGVRKEPC